MRSKINEESGKVFWITGLSGAGKTTIGKLLYNKIRENNKAVVFLDGDILRQVFGDDLGYTREDRYKSAMRNARLCRMLSAMGITVICSTISMFDKVRRWNRENIADYCEIYLKVSPKVLLERNQKGLYEQDIKSLVGFGIDMEEPKAPDIVFVNDGTRYPQDIVNDILGFVSKDNY